MNARPAQRDVSEHKCVKRALLRPDVDLTTIHLMKHSVAHIAGRVTWSALRNGAEPAAGLKNALDKVRIAADRVDAATKQANEASVEVSRAKSRLESSTSTANRVLSAFESPDISPAGRARKGRKARVVADRVVALSLMLDDRTREAAAADEALKVARRALLGARAVALRFGITPTELNNLLYPNGR
jgi:hypothetical protein